MQRAKEKKLRIRINNNVTLSRSRLFRYGPLVIWAALIFIGSGNVLSSSHTSFVVQLAHYLFPNAGPETLGLIHFLVRKAGHLTEYAILAWLAARAFRNSSRDFLRRRWFWAALVLVAAYSLSDEFHQSFVPTRGASIKDCLIDTVGGLMALIFLAIRWRVRKQRESAANRNNFAESREPARIRKPLDTEI